MENKEITINMTVSQWNVILSELANGKYGLVAPLISEIQKQANLQINDYNKNDNPLENQ